MIRGLISDALDYIVEEHPSHIDVAYKKFFGKNVLKENVDIVFPWFNEWLFFDFQMKEFGCTPLEFITINDIFGENEKRMREYRDLLKNTYSLFKVLDVKKNKSVTVEDIINEKEIVVKEKLATRQLQKGSVFFSRISKISENYEFVGANPITIPTLGQSVEEVFRRDLKKEKLSPKFVYESFHNARQGSKGELNFDFQGDLPLEQVEIDLKKSLDKFGVSKYITVEQIKEWIKKHLEAEDDLDDNSYLTIPVGLIDKDEYGTDAIHELTDRLNLYYMGLQRLKSSPKSILPWKGKKTKDIKDIRLNRICLDTPEYSSLLVEAHKKMGEEDYFGSLAKYQEFFKLLQNNHSTVPFLYRVIANYAMNCFLVNNESAGSHFIEKSLELNPKYSYALQIKEEYESGKLDDLISYAQSNLIQLRQKFEEYYREDTVHKWSPEKILKELKKFEVNINKEEFIEIAKKSNNVGQVCEKLFDPYFKTERDWEEDFSWIAAEALWKHWCPEQPCTEILMGKYYEMEDEYEKTKGEMYDKLIESFITLYNYIMSAPSEVIEKWQGYMEYTDNAFYMRETLQLIYKQLGEGKTLEIVEDLKNKMKDKLFGTINLYIALNKKESPEGILSRLLKGEDNNSPLIKEISSVFYISDQTKQAEEYLEKALEVAEKQKKGMEGLPKENQQYKRFMSDYEELVSYGVDCYEEHGKMSLSNKLKAKIRSEFSFDEEGVAKLFAKYEEEELAKDPVTKYLEFIKSYNINFAAGDTKSRIEDVKITPQYRNKNKVHRHDSKLGRNDPCSCGAKKPNGQPVKYKNCCGQ